MKWAQLNWLPAPLWCLWRDLTWCRRARSEWLKKMERYHARGGAARAHAVDRVRTIAFDGGCYDWDDNVPTDWALVLVRRWKLEPLSKPPGWHVSHENRAGKCCECGVPIGRYDSKYIEIAPPHRLRCLHWVDDARTRVSAIDESKWYYWTDG